MALSKTARFLSKAEILGVGVFSPLSIYHFYRRLGASVPQFWAPMKEVCVPHSWERTQKSDRINFLRGDFGLKKRSQTGHV